MFSSFNPRFDSGGRVNRSGQSSNHERPGKQNFYSPPPLPYEEEEGYFDDMPDREAIEALVYDQRKAINIQTVNLKSLTDNPALGDFDQLKLMEYFPNYHELILKCLISEEIIGLDYKIYQYPNMNSFAQVLKNWITLSQRTSQAYFNLSFEIISFLIGGLPKLHYLGTLNVVGLRQRFKKHNDVIIKRLIKHAIINSDHYILKLPTYGSIKEIFGENDSIAAPISQGVFAQLLKGIAQFNH